MQKKKITKILAILMAVFMISTVIVLPASAEDLDTPETQEIEEEYVNINSILLSTSVSSSTLTMTVTINGKSGTTYSSGRLNVTNSSGVTIRRWTGITSSSSSPVFVRSMTKPAAGKYTISFSIVATKGGVSETVTASKTVTVSK